MPFAFVTTEVLRRREERDKEKGYSKEFLSSRNKKDAVCMVAIIAALVGILACNSEPAKQIFEFWPRFIAQTLLFVAIFHCGGKLYRSLFK